MAQMGYEETSAVEQEIRQISLVARQTIVGPFRPGQQRFPISYGC